MNKYIIESVGTFFLVLTIGLSTNPLAIGIVLASMIYMGGYISGAHYNPAVTFAVFLQKKITSRDAMMYILFQFIGATMASLLFLYIKQDFLVVQPGSTVLFLVALILEILFTFALCSVVLHTAVSRKNTPNQFYGLAIGATVMAGAYSAGAISGGAFNPAVGVAPALINFLGNSQSLSNIALYILGPAIGAICASLLYTFTSNSER